MNMATKSNVPFLSSNVYRIGFKPIDGVKRSIILNKNGLRILIIGGSPDLGPFNELSGIDVKDYLEAIKEEIEANKEKYDLCIVLSHFGMDKDKKIAEKIEGIDVIIGGHFHILMDKHEIVSNKIIFTSGCFGENIGLLRMEINNGKIEVLESRNIDVQEYVQCNEIIDLLKENKEKAIDQLSEHLYDI